MRRKDFEVTDPQAIDEIIRACHCCRLGFADGEDCYIVPLSFGFCHEVARVLYFHSAREGRKLELARKYGRAAFEMDCGYTLHRAEAPCKYSCAVRSVMGSGSIREILDPAEKREALRHILNHTAGPQQWRFPEGAENTVTILKLTVEAIRCKAHG